MFGQSNNQNQPDAAAIPEQSIEGVLNDQPVAPTAPPAWQHPGTPIGDAAEATVETVQPTSSAPLVSPAPIVSTTVADTPAESVVTLDDQNDLIDIKQQALNQLSPLIGHLDQSPEERFRTTMMMIQASDNQALVKDAYAAAQAITDEKTRAQALLDIVNEINYFTQQHAE